MVKGSNPFRPALHPTKPPGGSTIAAKKIVEKRYYVLGHDLVPNHEILPKKEAEKIINDYNVNLEQLPRILDTDAAVIEIGAKPGDLVRITRKSRTAKVATAYRLVVSSGGN